MKVAPILFHRCRDKSVRPEEMVRMEEVAPQTNPSPLVLVVVVSRGDHMEVIRKQGAIVFRGSKEGDPVVVKNWLS